MGRGRGYDKWIQYWQQRKCHQLRTVPHSHCCPLAENCCASTTLSVHLFVELQTKTGIQGVPSGTGSGLRHQTPLTANFEHWRWMRPLHALWDGPSVQSQSEQQVKQGRPARQRTTCTWPDAMSSAAVSMHAHTHQQPGFLCLGWCRKSSHEDKRHVPLPRPTSSTSALRPLSSNK